MYSTCLYLSLQSSTCFCLSLQFFVELQYHSATRPVEPFPESSAPDKKVRTRQSATLYCYQYTLIHSLRFRAVLITSLTLSSLLKSNLMYALPTNCYWPWCTWNFPTSCKDERSAFTFRMFTLNRKSEKSDFEFFNNTVFISTHCEQ